MYGAQYVASGVAEKDWAGQVVHILFVLAVYGEDIKVPTAHTLTEVHVPPLVNG